jgi:polysaccharide export outer membrane protein
VWAASWVAVAACLAATTGCQRGARARPAPTAAAAEVAGVNQQIALAAGERPQGTADYRIGPDDLLEITLFDIEASNGEPRQLVTRVAQSGAITLPLVGQVVVGGGTPIEAEAALRDHYRRYIHDPQVTVFVKEYRSYRVSVVGYVEKPGVYEVSGQRTLLEVLALAGGLNESAGKTVQISRRLDDRLETLMIDLERLSREGDMDMNLVMRSGDVVNVPKAGIVYVQGSVKKPGAYRLREAMTVTQAIGAAGGPDDHLAKGDRARLFRQSRQGGRVEIPIDVEAINRGAADDVQLAENDIVVVPASLPRYIVDRFIGGIGMGLSVPIF